MSPVVRILNSTLIYTVIYLGLSPCLGLDVSASMAHASEVYMHTRKPHTRHQRD
uniref:Secreted protein n=1 Tax=Mesocestoides corti TaxID=53468 RepID=A0A5K3FPL3_MESCO